MEDRCTGCGAEVSHYNGVFLTEKGESRFLCSKCYNERISESYGVHFEHISFHPISLTDVNGEDHTFHFRTFFMGDHVNIAGLEIKDGEPEGYEFSQYDHAEVDLFELFAKLVDRLKRELGRKHIEPGELLPYQITDQNTVRGRITWDDETDGETPCLVIDGKALSWHEFGRMLMTYEGFHFKFEIFEGFEQR